MLRRRREIAVCLLGSSDARPCLGRAPGCAIVSATSRAGFMEIGLEVSKTLASCFARKIRGVRGVRGSGVIIYTRDRAYTARPANCIARRRSLPSRLVLVRTRTRRRRSNLMGRNKYNQPLDKAERKRVKNGASVDWDSGTWSGDQKGGDTDDTSATTPTATRSFTPRRSRSTRSASPRRDRGRHVYKLGIKLDAVAQHDVAARQLGVHAVHRGVVDEGEFEVKAR